MPKICYTPKNFKPELLRLIQRVDSIVERYQGQGLKLSLRQIYYVFVAKDYFPDDRRWSWNGSRWVRDPEGTKNADPNYKWLGDLVSDGRLAGLIDWEAIEDRGRNLITINHWDSPADIVSACAKQYRRDTWAGQKYHVECWVEKEALEGIFEAACRPLDVSAFACKGYVSMSAMWNAAQRLKEFKRPVVLHFGDHDPSGIDMTRDIKERLILFGVKNLELKRVALNMNQIEELDPPPSPAKADDARYRDYQERFGDDCWELDAIEPQQMRDLIRSSVAEYRDEDRYAVQLERQRKEKGLLNAVSVNWDEVASTYALIVTDLPQDEDEDDEDDEDPEDIEEEDREEEEDDEA